jgi:hypothetical protein
MPGIVCRSRVQLEATLPGTQGCPHAAQKAGINRETRDQAQSLIDCNNVRRALFKRKKPIKPALEPDGGGCALLTDVAALIAKLRRGSISSRLPAGTAEPIDCRRRAAPVH